MTVEKQNITRRRLLLLAGAAAGAKLFPVFASERADIPPQPYFAGVNRALETLAKLGAPVLPQDVQQLAELSRQNDRAAVDAAEKILDRYTLMRVSVEGDGYARTMVGSAPRSLIEQGWRLFLVRVSNPAGSTENLLLSSDSVRPITSASTDASRAGVPDKINLAPWIAQRWLTAEMYEGIPIGPTLSGFAVEYRVLQLHSRDRGRKSAVFYFSTATAVDPDLVKETRRTILLTFDCLPSRDVALQIRDADGRGCMASLTFKDKLGRVYPLQTRRLAPDMQFHPHIYRADGETVRLPDGEYTVEGKRGPEYLPEMQTAKVGEGQSQIEIRLKRWIDPSKWGWYSGDTHIHAAGCSHYEIPTEGVSPETMIRHVRGEGLAIGDVLTWGPGWYHQKQFFTGHTESPAASLEYPELQAANNVTLQARPTSKDGESLLRYDVEVSGFPSSYCGHLVLLRLKDQDYPGTKIIQDWPSWNLPILRWAKAQGGVAGYAHCGIGMVVGSTALPNYEIPPMDGIGTQEAIVDVTHGAVDFLSGCDTRPVAELNAWYHMLNCGFRLAMVGETDYPCISDERPGAGRSYVRLDHRPVDNAGYEQWIRNLQKGKLYCGDGRSHFLEFTANGHGSGEDDLALKAPGIVDVEALVSARLEPEPHHLERAYDWHLERARIGKSREVAVELVVNSLTVDKTTLVADGTPRSLKFQVPITRSSWVALRIFPSAHTHPVFVLVGEKAIRASKRSAEWCRSCVDKLWEVKSPFMRDGERPAAAEAYEHARKAYDKILAECEVE